MKKESKFYNNFFIYLSIFFLLIFNSYSQENVDNNKNNLYDTVKNIIPSVVKVNSESIDNNTKTIKYGSGIIISEDGFILTVSHIINDSNNINVILNDNESIKAKLIGMDKTIDIALLKIEKTNLSYIKLNKNIKYKITDKVISVSNPYNLGISVSTGIISSLNMDVKNNYFTNNLIQTDINLYEGSSGGGLFNEKGELIGLINFIYFSNNINNSLSFSIPIDKIFSSINELKNNGYIQKGYLGIEVEEFNKEKIKELNIEEDNMLMITNIDLNSPAKNILKVSDIILSYNNKNVTSINDFYFNIEKLKTNSVLKLKIYRNGKILNLDVKINNDTNANNNNYNNIIDKMINISDTLFIILDKNNKEYFDLSENEGLYVLKINKDSYFYENGIREKDIIKYINQNKVKNEKSLLNKIENNESFSIILKRNNKNKLIYFN